jgi:hypothetical protein
MSMGEDISSFRNVTEYEKTFIFVISLSGSLSTNCQFITCTMFDSFFLVFFDFMHLPDPVS